jgi:hypothetical protein
MVYKENLKVVDLIQFLKEEMMYQIDQDKKDAIQKFGDKQV